MKELLKKIFESLPYAKLNGPMVFNIIIDFIAAFVFIKLLSRNDVTAQLLIISFFGMMVFNLLCVLASKHYYKK